MVSESAEASAKASSPTDDITKLSFEEALAELETIVRRLEEGQSKLEDAIDAYARGTALKQHCEKKLKDARDRIEKIVLSSEGDIAVEEASFS